MKSLKLTFRSYLAASVILMSTAIFSNVYAQTSKSGADCNAANLTQALLGIGMSQNGIVNNATIPLFIVCSVDLERAGLGVLATSGDVLVEGVFPGVPAPGASTPGTIPCTYRLTVVGTTNTGSIALVITAGVSSVPPGSATDPLRGVGSANAANGGPILPLALAVSGNQNVVCALDPGEGIASVIVG